MTGGLVVVVLNWNGADDTLRCLHSLESAAAATPFRVLVVDNGSSDGSVGRIRREFPGTEILELPFNLGYAGGNNAGFRRAEEMGAEEVLFLNNDTVVDPGFALPLLTVLRSQSGAGAAVPKIFYMAYPSVLWYAGGEVSLRSGLVRHVGLRHHDDLRFSRPGTTGYATGCCVGLRVSVFRALGGFDESFGMYGEDVDLSLRLQAMGFRVVFVPSSRVWHRVSGGFEGRLLQKLWLRTASTVRLLRKHGLAFSVPLFLFLLPFRLVPAAMGMFFSVFRREGV
ncbi:MAG: glycosyltransferase family 2 protein [Chlorobium sp.]|nr:glycosyltransferase family 2 protein [Chlorobium phaeovibrioides]NQU46376.1 glycosyltransferase family 2 protein [Chlorobium sp.]